VLKDKNTPQRHSQWVTGVSQATQNVSNAPTFICSTGQVSLSQAINNPVTEQSECRNASTNQWNQSMRFPLRTD